MDYVKFVEQLQFQQSYVEYARLRVRNTVQFLFSELSHERKLAACNDISIVASLFLERQGIWSYSVTGACTLEFDRSTEIRPTHFWKITTAELGVGTGHGWLKAYPFSVVDIALPLQRYRKGEERHLKAPVVAEGFHRAEVQLNDLMSPGAIESWLELEGASPTLDKLLRAEPMLRDLWSLVGTPEIHLPKVRVRYVPCALGIFPATLEELKNIRLRNKYPIELWSKFVNKFPLPANVPRATAGA